MEKNKRFLLDTHILIWWMTNDRRLSKAVSDLLHNKEVAVFLSVASVWEMVIKERKNKLEIPYLNKEGISATGFPLLPIDLSHVLQVKQLPLIHNDPFDRMLIAQVKAEEGMTLITDDAKIVAYDVSVFPRGKASLET